MRVTEDRRAAAAARSPAVPEARAEARSFGETLARVRGEGRAEVERRRTAVDGAPRQKAAGVLGSRGPAPFADRADAPRGPRDPGARGGEAETLPAPSQPPNATPAVTAVSVALPSLREVVRALPPAIEAARARAGEPLALSFGPALTIDLRVGRDGVEVTLRPDPRLFRAAAAELPGLARALSARGVRLARARVEAALDRPDTRSGTVR